jgi:hypothetical protein
MIDRKIDNDELVKKGLIVDGVEILPPAKSKETLAQLRVKRQIPFYRHYGKIYYQMSELIEWAQSKKVEAVA